jgi:DNA-binding CsgD family transcriptional regulator
MATPISNASAGNLALDLGQLWGDLVSGRVRILEAFASEDRSYLALSLEPELRRRPPEACFRLLEQVLTGVSQKSVAIDHGVACSTVAACCRQALVYMGLPCLPSKVPPLLCLIALAVRQPELALGAWVCEVEHPEGPFRTLSAPRLEHGLVQRLSPAQTDVLRQLLDGRSYCEIARARGTSQRTVANQIAAVTSCLKVSGRLGLISFLTTTAGGTRT